MWTAIVAAESLGVPAGVVSGGALALLALVLGFQAKSIRDTSIRAKAEIERLTVSRAEEERRRIQAEERADVAEADRDRARRELEDARWHLRVLEDHNDRLLKGQAGDDS